MKEKVEIDVYTKKQIEHSLRLFLRELEELNLQGIGVQIEQVKDIVSEADKKEDTGVLWELLESVYNLERTVRDMKKYHEKIKEFEKEYMI